MRSSQLTLTNAVTIILATTLIMNFIDEQNFLGIFTIQSANITKVLPWQFITYALYVRPTFFSVFHVLIFYWFGSNLEAIWGTKQFAAFLLVGVLAKSISSFLFGIVPVAGSWELDVCIMTAFGFNFPHEEIRIYLILPIRVKILAIIFLGFAALSFLFAISLFFIPKYFAFSAGMISLPYNLAYLLVIVCSYLPLAVFFKYIFGDGHFRRIFGMIKEKQAEKQNFDALESMKTENKKIKELYENNKEEFARKHTIKSSHEQNTDHLCSEADFNEDDQYCLSCEHFSQCMKRKAKSEK